MPSASAALAAANEANRHAISHDGGGGVIQERRKEGRRERRVVEEGQVRLSGRKERKRKMPSLNHSHTRRPVNWRFLALALSLKFQHIGQSQFLHGPFV